RPDFLEQTRTLGKRRLCQRMHLGVRTPQQALRRARQVGGCCAGFKLALASLPAGLGMALMICGCGGRAPPHAPSEPPLGVLKVRAADVSLVSGESKQLTATGTFIDGSTQDLSTAVAWSSASTQVAMVSSTGLVTAKGAGLAAIAATSGTISAQASVNVTYQ